MPQCLVYALHVQPRVLPADVEALVDLLHSLALRTRGASCTLSTKPPQHLCPVLKGLVMLSAGAPGAGTGAGDMAAQHHAAVVLLALLLALLPGKPADAPGEAEDADDQALGARPPASAVATASGQMKVGFKGFHDPKKPVSAGRARRRAGGEPDTERAARGRGAAGGPNLNVSLCLNPAQACWRGARR